MGDISIDIGENVFIPDSRYFSEDDDFAQFQPTLHASRGGHKEPSAYAVISHKGFQHSELVTILIHLAKVEIVLSFIFMMHGSTCPGYSAIPAYQVVCHTNICAGLAGIVTGVLGLAALYRYRWKGMMVACLILAILSSAAFLLVTINSGILLDRLGKLKDDIKRTPAMNIAAVLLILGGVAMGVCFIITSTFICHYWSGRTLKYQVVGKIAQKSHTQANCEMSSPLLGAEEDLEMKTVHYHVCNAKCNHTK